MKACRKRHPGADAGIGILPSFRRKRKNKLLTVESPRVTQRLLGDVDRSTVDRATPSNKLSGLRRCALLAALLLSPAADPIAAGVAVPLEDVVRLVDGGRFSAAEVAIEAALADPRSTAADRRRASFERERMRRIRLDFSLGPDEAFSKLRERIPDLAPDDFAAWDAAGLLERMDIDGQRQYFNRAPSNLFRLSAEARERARPPVELVDGPMESANPHHREVREAALEENGTGVAPRRVRVTHSLTVEPDAVPAGETVRAWLPFPRSIPGQQERIELVASTPAGRVVAPETQMQRTVYLEQPALAGRPTRFSISYLLTVYGRHAELDPAKVVPARITPELAPFVAERPPHIVFSEAIRRYSREAVGSETNPLRIAQRLFAAVDRIPWAGAREYSTITNISDYALRAGHADCGQQTLLLMTLLRLNGIPSRWQSGWVYSDGEYDNMHDWGWLYLEPYGWLPMDVTFGRLKSGDPAIDGFYLGGLDAYRIAFNDDYGTPFHPPKIHERSETVDSQRGEAEWRGGNLYFDQWDYEFEVEIITREEDA
jgi:transglutaminase-like putative cysteine protease